MKQLKKKKNPKHVNSSTVLLLYFIALTCFFIAQKYQLPGLYDHVVRRLVTGPLDPAAGRQRGWLTADTDGSRTRLPGEAVKHPQRVPPACPKDHGNQTTLCQKHCPAPELRGRAPWGSVPSPPNKIQVNFGPLTTEHTPAFSVFLLPHEKLIHTTSHWGTAN